MTRAASMSTDPLELPDFLVAKNRKPLTPEQKARVDAALAKAAPPRDFLRRSAEDQARMDQEAEELRQKKIAAMHARIARSKEKQPKVPAGAVWDIRTSRWVLPGEKTPSISQLAREAKGPTTRQIMTAIRGQRAMNANSKPDFGSMSGPQLLAAYNELSTTKRKAKFSDRSQGTKACEAAWAAKNGGATTGRITATQPNHTEVDKPAAVEKAAKDLRVKAKAPDDGARAKRLEMKIKIVAAQNPRREKTDAHRHFEAMRGNITVGAYLAKFKPAERRTAAQWLSNTVRDGHVKVVE